MKPLQLHLISRKQAKAMGLKRFFTGKPCKYNQVALRRTSNGTCACFICNALRMNNVQEWRKNNKESYRAQQARAYKAAKLRPSVPTFTSKPI